MKTFNWRTPMKPRPPLRRPCRECNEYFYPTGKTCKLYEKCKKKINNIRKEKLRKIYSKTKEEYKSEYFSNKDKLDKLRDNVTLEKWKLLSKNYKLGKKIWTGRFTIEKLAKDMDMSYTTVCRCLSLNKANARSWKLVKEGKISAFKLAMICSRKKLEYQNKIVDMVIESKLSTYKIKDIKIGDVADVNKERHRLATEVAYSRKSSASEHFNNWIERGERFMGMDVDQLPNNKKEDIKNKLKELNIKIKEYIDKL